MGENAARLLCSAAVFPLPEEDRSTARATAGRKRSVLRTRPFSARTVMTWHTRKISDHAGAGGSSSVTVDGVGKSPEHGATAGDPYAAFITRGGVPSGIPCAPVSIRSARVEAMGDNPRAAPMGYLCIVGIVLTIVG